MDEKVRAKGRQIFVVSSSQGIVGPEFEHTPRTVCIYNTYKLHKLLFFNTIVANSTCFNTHSKFRAHTNELISPLRYNCLKVLFAQ